MVFCGARGAGLGRRRSGLAGPVVPRRHETAKTGGEARGKTEEHPDVGAHVWMRVHRGPGASSASQDVSGVTVTKGALSGRRISTTCQ